MLLAVGDLAPDPTAPDPATRLLGHSLCALAGRVPVTVAAAEVRASAASALARAGVTTLRIPDPAADLSAALTAAPGGSPRPTAVLAFDPGGTVAGALLRSAITSEGRRSNVTSLVAEVPLVVVVTRPLTGALAAAAAPQVLAAAQVVLAVSDELADDVRSSVAESPGPPADVRVLHRPLPTWSAVALHPAERHGLVVPGRWHTDPTFADVLGLVDLADTADRLSTEARREVGPIRVLGLDGAAQSLVATRRLGPRAPAGLAGAVAFDGPRSWDDRRAWTDALRWSRVAVLARPNRGDPLLADDLVAAGLPTVAQHGASEGHPLSATTGGAATFEEVLDTAVRLAADVAHWRTAAEAVRSIADGWPNGPTVAEQVVDVLRELGVGRSGPLASRSTPVALGEPPSLDLVRPVERPGGTLAAASRAAEAHERRLGLRWHVPRVQGLRVQQLVDADVRERWWRAVHEEPTRVLDRARRTGLPLHRQPRISLLVPCYHTPRPLLDALVRSITGQVYPHWQLCLVDDGSDDAELTARLDELAASDPRIVVAHRGSSGGIAAATNDALALADGELVATVDHDDELHPAALWRIAERFDLEPDLDAVYSDEDKLDSDGRRTHVHRKPDWSPDQLLGGNYVNHLAVIRRERVVELGGWRSDLDGSQDLDLWLRLSERTDRIGHVARPLYHWRAVEGSAAADARAKVGAGANGRQAIADALVRRGTPADVTAGLLDTWHHVHWPAVSPGSGEAPLVSIVIPTRDRGDLVARCLETIRATTRHPWELVLVDNDSTDPASVSLFAELESDGATVVRYPHEFHFARQANLGVAAARGPLVLVLNNDTEALHGGWLDEAVGHAVRPEVGAVGVRLLRPEGGAQHEGIVIGVGGAAWNLDSGDHAEWGRWVRDAAAVTGAAVLARRSVLHAVGGFDDGLRVAMNDVDLCLRISAMGWRVVYTPFAELSHGESVSRGTLHPREDEARYVARWGSERCLRDPFWNAGQDMINADNLVL